MMIFCNMQLDLWVKDSPQRQVNVFRKLSETPFPLRNTCILGVCVHVCVGGRWGRGMAYLTDYGYRYGYFYITPPSHPKPHTSLPLHLLLNV